MKLTLKRFRDVLALTLAFSPIIAVIYMGLHFGSTMPLNNAYDYMCDNNMSYPKKEYVLYCSERMYDKQLELEK